MISCGVICNVYLRCKQTKAISAVRNSRGTTGYIRWNRAADSTWTVTTSMKIGGVLFASATATHDISYGTKAPGMTSKCR